MSNALNIDLWFRRLDAPGAHIVRWQRHLNDAELARMAKFVFERDRARFTICRSRMRRILGQYTGTNPGDIAFATTGRDKPVLAGANPRAIAFNLTHTGGLACLAVTHGEAVGVDLELIRDVREDFIVYALNPPEHAPVLALDPAAREPAFYRYWTAKEAFLKATGTGLWRSLKTFDADVPLKTAPHAFAPCALPRIDDPAERARNWHLYTFTPTPEHVGALACAPPPGTALNIRTRWIATPAAAAPRAQ